MIAESAHVELDEEAGGDCPAELYAARTVATGIAGFAAVTDEQVARFHEQGYLVVHEAFTSAEVTNALDGLLDLLDGVYPGYRGIQYERSALERVGTLGREHKQDAVRKLWKMVDYDTRVAALAQHPQLLALVERLPDPSRAAASRHAAEPVTATTTRTAIPLQASRSRTHRARNAPGGVWQRGQRRDVLRRET